MQTETGKMGWSGLFSEPAVRGALSSSRHSPRKEVPARNAAGSAGSATPYSANASPVRQSKKNQQQEDQGEEIWISWQTLQAAEAIQPRGLANCGNMCFLNCIVQVVLHCAPVASLFARLGGRLAFLDEREAPFLKSIGEIFAQLVPTGADSLSSPPAWQPPIVPEMLYECLRARSASQAFQGAQEDAQEFLTYLVDQLHEELLRCQNDLQWTLSPPAEHEVRRQDTRSHDDAGSEWMEVGRRQKISIARMMEHQESPISYLFFGRYRSILKRPGSKDSITSEPFHCISLEIQDECIFSLHDALQFMSRTETIKSDGVKMTKSLSIQKSPPVLIFHLKRFLYDQACGTEKLTKPVAFPERLELDGSPVFSESRPASTSTFRLFAVAYHHGRSAQGGHYTCHVRQTARPDDPWVYFDDSSYVLEPLEKVLREKPATQSPYLLFYLWHEDPPSSSRRH